MQIFYKSKMFVYPFSHSYIMQFLFSFFSDSTLFGGHLSLPTKFRFCWLVDLSIFEPPISTVKMATRLKPAIQVLYFVQFLLKIGQNLNPGRPCRHHLTQQKSVSISKELARDLFSEQWWHPVTVCVLKKPWVSRLLGSREIFLSLRFSWAAEFTFSACHSAGKN